MRDRVCWYRKMRKNVTNCIHIKLTLSDLQQEWVEWDMIKARLLTIDQLLIVEEALAFDDAFAWYKEQIKDQVGNVL